MKTSLASAASLGALLVTAPALALNQPDGTAIPINTAIGLQHLFDSRGETIDALAQAAITPQTFIPGCGLTFEVLQRNGGYKNSFGWYNVTGAKPDNSELHEFLSCNDGVGTSKVLDIKSDPGYAGGEVGFYQATGACGTTTVHEAIFYSEPKYNPDNSSADPFIHLLIYNSTVTSNAFYFGWEDLLSGGDNDFDDLTTFVTGITCSGGGGACDTGQQGVCAGGTMQCQGGDLTCVPSTKPSAEKCDAFDNDCNGLVDDGDLCAAGEICDQGSCVPRCGGGEFQCAGGKVCAPSGYCVDPGCDSVSCGAGERCVAGACVAPCEGVVCPGGQVCLAGACVDPCGGLTCDEGQVCVAGACVDSCACGGCGAGDSCQDDGRCVATACVGVTCPAGEQCTADGNCEDACAGVVCPKGEACVTGQCVEGSGGGSGGGGGGVIIDDGDGGGGNGNAGGSGANASNGAGGGGGGGDAGSSSGCGCSVPGAGESRAGALLGLSVLGLLSALSRRRGRRARS